MGNKKIILIASIVGAIIIVGLVIAYFYAGTTSNNTLPTDKSVFSKVQKSFDLSKDQTFFSNDVAQFQYDHNKNLFTVRLAKSVTSPQYQADKVGEVEQQIAKTLKLTSQESCLIPIQFIDYQNNFITRSACAGDE